MGEIFTRTIKVPVGVLSDFYDTFVEHSNKEKINFETAVNGDEIPEFLMILDTERQAEIAVNHLTSALQKSLLEKYAPQLAEVMVEHNNPSNGDESVFTYLPEAIRRAGDDPKHVLKFVSLKLVKKQQIPPEGARYIKVDKHIILDDFLTNDIIDPSTNSITMGEYKLPIDKKKNVYDYVCLDYTPTNTKEPLFDTYLTLKQCLISDAVMTLWATAEKEAEKHGREGVPYIDFTDEQIYKLLPGSGSKITETQRNEIHKTMLEFGNIDVTYDVTERVKKRKSQQEDTKEYKVKSKYFQLETVIETDKYTKEKREFYRIISKPIMLRYAGIGNYVRELPRNVWEVPIDMNDDRYPVFRYMLSFVLTAKHSYSDAKKHLDKDNAKIKNDTDGTLKRKTLEDYDIIDTITFDKVFKMCGLKNLSTQKTKRGREFIFRLLDEWKKADFIKGYTAIKKGRATTAVKIDVKSE